MDWPNLTGGATGSFAGVDARQNVTVRVNVEKRLFFLFSKLSLEIKRVHRALYIGRNCISCRQVEVDLISWQLQYSVKDLSDLHTCSRGIPFVEVWAVLLVRFNLLDRLSSFHCGTYVRNYRSCKHMVRTGIAKSV
jgi:hypothetical protein